MILRKIIPAEISAVILFLFLINIASCASGQVKNGSDRGDGGSIFKIGDGSKYSDLLVDIKSYTTNGAQYQEKHQKLILSMAGDIVNGQDLDISKGSIGFYYDKKSQRTDRLFFGLDINIERESQPDYVRFSVKLIKENVSGIIDTVYKYKPVLEENEIVGVVIGFRWKENGSPQQVNIWLKKDDIRLFYDGKITQNELYQRSTITNTAGKVILLPI